jgi:hypothetical protein
MKKLAFIVLLLSLISFSLKAQNMTTSKLNEIITKVSDTVQQQNGTLKFLYNEALLVCMTDENANRMRIISPIVEVSKLNDEEFKNALLANFHTALDVKYAISDDILWSVFIHPLKELSEQQVEDAINQVYRANATFGSTYSSTNLVFPGNLKKEGKKIEEKLLKKT